MNEALVLGLIGLVVAGFVLRPLLRRRQDPSPRRPAVSASVAGARPASAAAEQLAELELDRAMGRVNEADFTRWKGELEAGADDAAVPDVPNEDAAPSDATARAEALVRKWREAPRPSCPNCGERPEAGARYCSNCGASLPA